MSSRLVNGARHVCEPGPWNPLDTSRFSHLCDVCRPHAEAAWARKESRGVTELRDHPLRAIVRAHLRAQSLGLPATLQPEEWAVIYAAAEGRCVYCRAAPAAVIEHRVPLSRGGGTTAENCVPACHQCNARKGAR